MILKYLFVSICAFAVSWLVTKRLIPSLSKKGMLDLPNDRSSHTIATPRGGGLGILAGLGVGFLIARWFSMPLPGMELLLATCLIAALGLIDDRYHLSALTRLIFQLIAAAIVVYKTGGVSHLPLPKPFDAELESLTIPFSIIWVIGLTNVYNFLDGIDGFASLQGVIAGLGIAVMGQGSSLSICGWVIAGACTGFLLQNWHPAKIFMGDIGSAALGFLLATLPFQAPQAQRSDVVFGIVLCLWFFISDGIFTLLRRLFRGERIWVAHRSHLYQRLTKTDLRHDQVTLRVLGAGAVLAAVGAVSLRFSMPILQWTGLSIALGSFLVYYGYTLLRERAYTGSRVRFVSPPPYYKRPSRS